MKHPDLHTLLKAALADLHDPETFLDYLLRRTFYPTIQVDAPEAWKDRRAVWAEASVLTQHQPEGAEYFLDSYATVLADRAEPDIDPMIAALDDMGNHDIAHANKLQQILDARQAGPDALKKLMEGGPSGPVRPNPLKVEPTGTQKIMWCTAMVRGVDLADVGGAKQ